MEFREFNEALDKYDYYNNIEPYLSLNESIIFETVKSYIDSNNINGLKLYISGYGYINVLNKIRHNEVLYKKVSTEDIDKLIEIISKVVH